MTNCFNRLLRVFLLLLGVVFLALSGNGASKASHKADFRDFNGVVYLPGPKEAVQLGIGWARDGFYWNVIEPEKGVWDWAKTDQKVLSANAESVQILPLLAYNTPWDASVPGNGFSPPERMEDWEDFVEHVVARYSAPPFNLRYFQVWNEPTRQAGFWTGSDQEFVDKVYLPAARIIRRHHCFVVFGGWPASNSLQEYDSVLEYHNAWRWTDILDVHYEGLPYWQYLYNHWVRSGKCKGVWETELGFTDDPDFIPATYLSMLYWSLKTGWKNPDQYKLFWYATWGAGADGPRCLSQTDASGRVVLSAQGKRLALLYQLLGAVPLGAFSDYAVVPSSSKASVLGFRSEHRIVVAVLLDKELFPSLRSILIRVPLARKPARVALIDEDGAPLMGVVHFRKHCLTVKAPLQPVTQGASKLAIAYLEVDPFISRN